MQRRFCAKSGEATSTLECVQQRPPQAAPSSWPRSTCFLDLLPSPHTAQPSTFDCPTAVSPAVYWGAPMRVSSGRAGLAPCHILTAPRRPRARLAGLVRASPALCVPRCTDSPSTLALEYSTNEAQCSQQIPALCSPRIPFARSKRKSCEMTS